MGPSVARTKAGHKCAFHGLLISEHDWVRAFVRDLNDGVVIRDGVRYGSGAFGATKSRCDQKRCDEIPPGNRSGPESAK